MEPWKDCVALSFGSIFAIFGSGWVALPQIDPIHNLDVLLDSQLLLKEQMAVLTRTAFAQLCVVFPPGT